MRNFKLNLWSINQQQNEISLDPRTGDGFVSRTPLQDTNFTTSFKHVNLIQLDIGDNG